MHAAERKRAQYYAELYKQRYNKPYGMGWVLRYFRKLAGIRMADLWKKAGYPETRLYTTERKHMSFSRGQVSLFAELYGVNKDVLLIIAGYVPEKYAGKISPQLAKQLINTLDEQAKHAPEKPDDIRALEQIHELVAEYQESNTLDKNPRTTSPESKTET